MPSRCDPVPSVVSLDLSRGTVATLFSYHYLGMNLSRRTRRFLLAFLIYLTACTLAGIYVADGALQPGRRPLTHEETAAVRDSLRNLGTDILLDVSITTPD